MAKNITLKLDDAVLRECRQQALKEDKSVSQWVAEMIIANITRRSSFKQGKASALKMLRAYPLKGTKLSRDELHERR